VPVNGKGNLINAIALARGLEIPYFAVFDGDMNLNNNENIDRNKTIFAVMGYTGPSSDGVLASHLVGNAFCVWKDSLQSAILEKVPAWENDRSAVCADFGWTVDRLKKNAMVMEATLERAFKGGAIEPLELLCGEVTKKFGREQALTIV